MISKINKSNVQVRVIFRKYYLIVFYILVYIKFVEKLENFLIENNQNLQMKFNVSA